MNIEEGINRIFEGNCMLFLGSGFSLGSTNVEGNNLVSAFDLSKFEIHFLLFFIFPELRKKSIKFIL